MSQSPLEAITQALTLNNLETIQISTIIDGLVIADDQYFNEDDCVLSDVQYDTIRLYAKQQSPSDVYFTGVGSQVRGGKVLLPHTMGSLNQVYEGDFVKWVNKHTISQEVLVISNKLDGNSALVVYDKHGELQIAFSRGDGTYGADISRHIIKLHNAPKQIDTNHNTFIVRGEVIISVPNFNKIKSLIKSKSGRIYRNPRNFVSGRMNASAGHDIAYSHIQFIAYEIVDSTLSKLEQLTLLHNIGFEVVPHTAVLANTLNDAKLTEMLISAKHDSDYELDGLVIDVNSNEVRAHINPTKDTLNPEYAVKFKVTDSSNYAEPVVVGVELNISKDGFIKPTILIEPTQLVGVTISRCTGFNMAFIYNNRIMPGVKIKLTRAGDVTPKCGGVVCDPHDTPLYDFQDWIEGQLELQNSTIGGYSWTLNGNGDRVDLCINDIDNDTARFQQLVDFFNSIDVPNLGEGNLRPMFDAGFETPESIIDLTQEDIGCLINSLVTGKKIFKGIRDKLTNIPMYILMGSHKSMGRGIGKRKMKRLYDAFSGDMTKCTDVNSIINIEGFDTKSANKIVAGYLEFDKFYNSIKHNVKLELFVPPTSGSMSGFNVCYTGVRDKTQELAIVNAGGKIATSVSSKTTHLVTNDPMSTSGKAQKARDLGVQVLGLNNMWNLIKG